MQRYISAFKRYFTKHAHTHHRLYFAFGRQYVSCGQQQPPLSGAAVNKTAVNYHDGEMDPSGFRVRWNSSSLRDICPPI